MPIELTRSLQVMAIATLAECYNNLKVFQGVVKIRKGVAVSLMMHATSMDEVYGIFDRYIHVITGKVCARERLKGWRWYRYADENINKM